MHEYHGAVQIIEHAEDLCRERKHNQVNKIQLLIGEASGYSFEVVKGYFEEASVGTGCEGAEVTVRKTALMLRCPKCNEHFPKRLLQYDCPLCGTPGNPTDAGKEMTIDFMESEWVEEKGDILARSIKKQDVIEFFDSMLNKCLEYGIHENQLCFDIGIGFGKSHEHNIELIKNIDKLKQKDIALLTALSMKRVVKNTTNVEGDDLLYGTISANILAINGGTDIIRVHNVKENVLAAKMVDAVVRG